MNWQNYVGELFEGPDYKIYEAESYDGTSFRISELACPTNRITLSPGQLVEQYQYIPDSGSKPRPTTIKNSNQGYNLLDRAVLNLHLNMPIPELVGLFRAEGYDMYDIFLTIRGAELIVR